VPLPAHSPVTQSGFEASESCINHLLHQSTGTSNNFQYNYDEYNHLSPYVESYESLQYPTGTSPSTTFIEDAQYLLGANANFDNSVYYNPISNLDDGYNGTSAALHDPTMMNVAGQDPAAASALSQDLSTNAAQPVVTNPPQPSGQSPLTCPHGCRGTFSRPGEYRRHMRKHGTHQHLCPRPGCGKTFYRMDKVRDHLRQFHKIS
jgi:hypothetical protein